MQKFLVAVIACVVALAWTIEGNAAPHFGILTVSPDSAACLSIRTDSLQAGDSVLVVLQAGAVTDSATVVRGQVERGLREPCQKLRGVLGDSVYAYAVRLEAPAPLVTGPAIAVVGSGLVALARGDTVVVRAPGERELYAFRVCASTEGMHFTAWQGHRRVWHEYYYLGFDVEPDCTEEEVGDER